jgi:Protein of Unknown function (DUF2604)
MMAKQSGQLRPIGRFTIVVMGKSEAFEIQEQSPLSKPSEEALRRTHNNPDLSKWVLKNSQGIELSFSETEKQAGIKGGDVLYLSPKIGAGGA